MCSGDWICEVKLLYWKSKNRESSWVLAKKTPRLQTEKNVLVSLTMAEIQTDYLSQLRTINEHRGKLGHLAAIGTHDLRTASIVHHEYKPFNNPFNNISNKNHQSISNISLGISPMHNITLSSVDVGHHSTTNHHQTLVELKQSYSPPSTPHSPTTSEVHDTKVSWFLHYPLSRWI